MTRVSAAAAGIVVSPWQAATERAFPYGVASGDPLPDRVVLWTRVAATTPVAVRWEIARDPELATPVSSGEALAEAAHDFTVHVDAADLEPDTVYFFRFRAADGTWSPVGRTRTAPAPGARRPVRLGVVSCASQTYGEFNAYARLAARDVDLVVHLGDVIYEQGDVSLGDYRRRHAEYRTDRAWQTLLRRHPVAAVWDDHDVAGNAWRDEPGAERRAAAVQAWLEWMPVRRPDPAHPQRIWRSLRWGGVAELLLLDTRLDGRDRQVGRDDPEPAAAVADPQRSLIGRSQRAWLHEHLRESVTAWRVLGNQVMLSPLEAGGVSGALARLAGGNALAVDGRLINPDQWDGYVAERDRLLAVLAERPGTTVVLTGDIHSSWASEVPGDDGSVAVEVVTPAVASETFGEVLGGDLVGRTGIATGIIRAQNPHVRWADVDSHGYAVVELRADGMSADWWHVDTVDRPSHEERFAAGWDARLGDPHLRERDQRLETRGPSPPEPAADEQRSGRGGAPRWVWGTAGTAAAAIGAGLVALRRRRR